MSKFEVKARTHLIQNGRNRGGVCRWHVDKEYVGAEYMDGSDMCLVNDAIDGVFLYENGDLVGGWRNWGVA